MMMPLSTQHDHEKTLVMIMIIMLVYKQNKHDECGGDLRIGNRGPMGSVNEDEPLSIRS
jgi:hypothetical protein